MNKAHFNREARRILALFLYEHGKLSRGKACELGGMSQWAFAVLNGRLGVPADYEEDNLGQDMQRLTNV